MVQTSWSTSVATVVQLLCIFVLVLHISAMHACHNDFQRLTSMSKSKLPQYPVGPAVGPQLLSSRECSLHVRHPPTGEEFALGVVSAVMVKHFETF